MGTRFLPVAIKRVIVDPNQTYKDATGSTAVDIDAFMADANSSVVEVDIGVHASSSNGHGPCGIQVDGLALKAIAEPQPLDDRNIFVKTVWDIDSAHGLTSPSPVDVDIDKSTKMTDLYEQITLFYMRNLVRQVRPAELAPVHWHHQELYRYINTVSSTVAEGNHPVWQREWLMDSRETIGSLVERYPDDVDIAMLTAVGENLPSVVRGESSILEHMLQDNLLGRLYRESSGLAACNGYVAQLMRQLSHKHPRTKVLEIGTGTGGTTMSAPRALGEAYSSYTCTDISTSFFNGLAEGIPKEHAQKVDFKVFNIEMAPADQGFVEASYDVVIAANVLHATRKLSKTMQNTRAFLRPGGYLIAVEVTGTMLRETGLMGGLEGWWLGTEEGRRMGPGVGPKQWDDVLEQSGFSGIDCILHDHPDVSRHSCSVFASQAVDDRLRLLREPLGSMDLIPESPVLIIGGKTLAVSKLVRQIEKTLRRWSANVQRCESVDELESIRMMPGTFVLCLSDLDKPFFAEPLAATRLNNLQEMLGTAANVLWVTCGRVLEDPYANMMVGVGRALAVELPHVNIHYFDFDRQASWDKDAVLSQLFRMAATLSPQIDMKNALWVQEPELLVKGTQIRVPRVVPDHGANETLNAKRRRITKSVDISERLLVTTDTTASQPLLVAGGPL